MGTTIHTEGKIALVAGLEWRQLFEPGGARREAEVRELARDSGCTSVVRVDTANHACVGLFAPLEDDKPGGRLGIARHSVAAILSSMAADELIVAALHLPEVRRVAVVAVERGVPAIDLVQSVERAQDTVSAIRSGKHGFAGHRLFTNDTREFPYGEEFGLDALARAAVPSTRLRRPPPNKLALSLALLASLLLALALAGGRLYWETWRNAERLRAARAADPVPQYQAQLQQRIGKLGIPAPALASWARQIEAYPLWVAGWELKAITCAAGECESEWDRRGGTTFHLQADRPRETLDVRASTADRAVFRWKTDPLLPRGLPSLQEARPLQEALVDNISVWQTWSSAGVALAQTGRYVQWPLAEPAVPDEVSLKARSIEATLPFVMLQDLLGRTPRDVWWSQVRLAVDMAGRERALTVTLKGNSYAR